MAISFDNFVWGDQTPTPAQVTCFQDRSWSHRTTEDGGEIRRVFYIQPASAVKSLLVALRGTFIPNLGGLALGRVKPHQDQSYPNYYCVETEDVPMDIDSISGSSTSGFIPQDPGGTVVKDLTALRKCLDAYVPSYDYDATLNMSAPEIQAGKPNYTAAPYSSYGTNGSLVTAIYKPLVFAQNLSTTQDPFDWVNPLWEPFTKSEVIGKDLQFQINSGVGAGSFGGVSTSAVYPEACAHVSIQRLMVPYVPKNHIALLVNKLNSSSLVVGDWSFPKGTWRTEAPDVAMKITPDGQRYCNITINGSVRMLYGSQCNGASGITGGVFVYDWATWNHYMGQPTTLGFAFAPQIAGYPFGMYLTGWNDGLFQTLGKARPLYLYDNMIHYDNPATSGNYPNIGNKQPGSVNDLFYAGFATEPLTTYTP